jgi:hypothetical protein
MTNITAIPEATAITSKDTNTIVANSLSTFLAKRNLSTKPPPRPPLTHTSFHGGAYALDIEEQDIFLKYYTSIFTNTRNNCNMSFVERHHTPLQESLAPVIIDLDFRMDTLHRPYTMAAITAFIDILYAYLKEYIIDPDPICYILEKHAPKDEKGVFKDGIHIIFPHIVTCPTLQYIIRDRFLQEHTAFFTSHMPTAINTPNDIYDESVIFRNGWMMYGSKKPHEPHRWLATHVYNGKFLDTIANPFNPHFVTLFSIRNKRVATALSTSAKSAIAARDMPLMPKSARVSAQSATARSTAWIHRHIREIVDMLAAERAHDYHSWIEVGLALCHIDPGDDMFEAWAHFSSKSPKFDLWECEQVWDSLQPSGAITFGSLYYWAHQDNPVAAAKLFANAQRKSRAALKHLRLDVKQLRIPYESYAAPHVKPLDLENNDIIVLCSRLGTGKTHAIIDAIKSGNYPRILIISPRIMYSSNIQGRMANAGLLFDIYFDLPSAIDLSDVPRLIISPESIHKLTCISYDLVILDEIEANMLQFSSEKTMKHKTLCITKFMHIIQASNKVIACDGRISPRTIHALSSFDNKRTIYIENTAVKLTRRAIHLIPAKRGPRELVANQGAFIEMLNNDLKIGKRLAVFTASNTFGLRIIEELRADPTLAHIRLKYYNAETDDMEKREVAEVNAVWVKYDIVIYTPVITVGVDFNVAHFDRMYAWLSNKTVRCRTSIQAIHRVRQLKEDVLYVFMDDTVSRPTITNPEEWRDILQQKQTLIIDEYENVQLHMTQVALTVYDVIIKDTNKSAEEKVEAIAAIHRQLMACPGINVPDMVIENEVYNALEQDVDHADFVESMYEYLRNEGYEIMTQPLISVPSIPSAPKETCNTSDVSAAYEEVNLQDYEDAKKRIITKTAKRVDHQTVKHYEFKCAIRRMLPRMTKDMLTVLYKAMQDRNVEKWVTNLLMELHGNCLKHFEDSVHDSPMLIFADTLGLRANYMSELVNLLGMSNSLDCQGRVLKKVDIIKVEKELKACLKKLAVLESAPFENDMSYKQLSGRIKSVLYDWSGVVMNRMKCEGKNMDAVYSFDYDEKMINIQPIIANGMF